MRGANTVNRSLFSVRHLDGFVTDNLRQRPTRKIVNLSLQNIEPTRANMHPASITGGRPSIAPQDTTRAMLPRIFHSIRCERTLMGKTQCSLKQDSLQTT